MIFGFLSFGHFNANLHRSLYFEMNDQINKLKLLKQNKTYF